MKVLKGKASTAELDNLHNIVASVISKELRMSIETITEVDEEGVKTEISPLPVDTKLLATAIKFLKDNDITAEVLESNAMKSLTDNIKEIASKDNELKEISVEDMLAIAERK